jgi:outer membrane protein OmpA-like peptidoglycan-associated protein
MTKTRLSPAMVALLALGASATFGRTAKADDFDLTINAEGGAGTMLSSQQRDALKYNLALEGAVRPGIVILDPLTLQLDFGSWWFPSSQGYGRATLLGFGLRLDPMLGTAGRLVLDGHTGIGLTGSVERAMFDFGVGFEFALGKSWGLGPVVRYGQVVHDQAVDTTEDAKFFAVALSLTFRPQHAPPPPPPPPAPPAPPAPVDTDGDGIPDSSDVCPTDAAGAHPDTRANRHGCPAIDSDNDGVTDDVDQCPDVPQGAAADPTRLGCPDGDDDKDGIPNHEDQCPTEPAGMQPDPARVGCPAPDKDKDSVPDAVDACPDKPGAPSSDPKKNGCPGLVAIDAGKIRINEQVFFATGKETILPKSFALLKAVGDAMRGTPGIKKISVEGHTDTTGKADHNLELSQKRAESVVQWLVKDGIDASRLEAKGFGGTKPIADNKTAKGRAENRRVDFVIVDPPQALDAPQAPAPPPAPDPAAAPAAPADATPPAAK